MNRNHDSLGIGIGSPLLQTSDRKLPSDAREGPKYEHITQALIETLVGIANFISD